MSLRTRATLNNHGCAGDKLIVQGRWTQALPSHDMPAQHGLEALSLGIDPEHCLPLCGVTVAEE